MLKAQLAVKVITEDTDNFSLKGMIEPTFYNFGTQAVDVFYSPIEPNGHPFAAGVAGMVMDSEIPIKFKGSDKKGRKLLCYYGSPIIPCD